MGTGKETGKSMRTRLSKLPSSDLTFSFSRCYRCRPQILRSAKLQNKSSTNFSNFVSNFSPNFLEEFLCFVSWEKEARKFSPKIPPFFNAKFPGQLEAKIHETLIAFRSVWDFLGLFQPRNFLGVWSLFLLFARVVLGSEGVNFPWCFGWFSLVFIKRPRNGRSGKFSGERAR